MKIFVFGAGASRGAQDQKIFKEGHEQRAPLINELFRPYYLKGLVSGLSLDLPECQEAAKKAGSLEKWLTSKWDSISQIGVEKLRRAEKSWFGNINLYIWNVLNYVSQSYPNAQGYGQFLTKLREKAEDFGLVSFNYDTLMDQAYQDVFQKSLSEGKAYLSEDIVKLHGSINWFLKSREGDDSLPHARHRGDTSVRVRLIAENFYNGGPLEMNKLEVIDPKHSSLKNLDVVMSYFSSGNFYPLLFMPLVGKMYDTVSGFSNLVLAKAEEMFRKASDIYLIGYSASDSIIHDLVRLAPPKTKLHVVGMGSAKKIASHVISQNRNLEEGLISDRGFQDFINNYGV